MSHFNISRRSLMTSVGAAAVLSAIDAIGTSAWAASGRGPGPASGSAASDFLFVDSNAAQLAGIKRVIIINYVIAFQTQGTTTPPSMGSSITTVGTNSWDNIDTGMLQEITDNGLAKLKASFRERNIEVLDESVLSNQPDYAKILQATGFDAPVNWANSDGKTILVGATGLRPFISFSPEVGNLEWPIVGRTKDAVAHPPSVMGRYNPYKMPSWEIDLAKALDAVVVKAWQVVNFAKVAAGSSSWSAPRNWITFGGTSMTFHEGEVSSTTYSSNASSHLMIRQGASRLSFRLPDSTKRAGSSVIQNPLTYLAYPKDGDVVVVLGNPYFLGSQFFSIGGGGESSGQSARRAILGGVAHSDFTAILTKPAEYKAAVNEAISNIMGGFVGTALGR